MQHDTTIPDKDHDSWELHRCGSMKCDTPQGIPTQQPSLQLKIQCTNSPKYLPSLTSSPNNHSSYNSSDRKLQSAQAVALPPSPPTVHQNVPYMVPLPLMPLKLLNSMPNHQHNLLKHGPPINRYQSKKNPKMVVQMNRMTIRSRSATGGCLEGVSTGDLPIGTNQKCAILGASII